MKKIILLSFTLLFSLQTYANCSEPITINFDYICDGNDLTIVEFAFILTGGSGVYDISGCLNIDMVNEGEELVFTALGGEQVWLQIEDANGDCEPLYFIDCSPFCYQTGEGGNCDTPAIITCNPNGSFNAIIILLDYFEPPITVLGDTTFITNESTLLFNSLSQNINIQLIDSNDNSSDFYLDGEGCPVFTPDLISVDAINPANLNCSLQTNNNCITKAENKYPSFKR